MAEDYHRDRKERRELLAVTTALLELISSRVGGIAEVSREFDVVLNVVTYTLLARLGIRMRVTYEFLPENVE